MHFDRLGNVMQESNMTFPLNFSQLISMSIKKKGHGLFYEGWTYGHILSSYRVAGLFNL